MVSVVVCPALLGGSVVAIAVALRVNVLGPNSRVWRTCLFCAGWAGIVGVVLSVAGLGLPAQPGDAVFFGIIAVLCVVAGAVAGLVLSFWWRYVGRRLAQ